MHFSQALQVRAAHSTGSEPLLQTPQELVQGEKGSGMWDHVALVSPCVMSYWEFLILLPMISVSTEQHPYTVHIKTVA